MKEILFKTKKFLCKNQRELNLSACIPRYSQFPSNNNNIDHSNSFSSFIYFPHQAGELKKKISVMNDQKIKSNKETNAMALKLKEYLWMKKLMSMKEKRGHLPNNHERQIEF
jgi:hypothetical protein